MAPCASFFCINMKINWLDGKIKIMYNKIGDINETKRLKIFFE